MRHALGMAALAVLCLLSIPAQAQDTTVGLGGLFEVARPYLVEVTTVLIAALLAVVTRRLHAWAGIQIEAKHREALQSALMNGVNAGLEKVGDLANHARVDLKHEILAEAAGYVERSVPDALKFLGVTPERLRELLQAKLPVAGKTDA